MASRKTLVHRIEGGCPDVDIRLDDDTHSPIKIIQGDDSIWLDRKMAELIGEVLIELSGESTNG